MVGLSSLFVASTPRDALRVPCSCLSWSSLVLSFLRTSILSVRLAWSPPDASRARVFDVDRPHAAEPPPLVSPQRRWGINPSQPHTHTPSHSHTVALTTSHTHLSHTDSQPHSHSPRHTTCVTTSHTRTVSHPISHTHAQLRSVVLPCTVRRGKGSTEVQHGSMSCRHFHLGRNGDGDRWSGRIHTYVDSRSYPIRTMVRPHPHAPPRDRDTLLTER